MKIICGLQILTNLENLQFSNKFFSGKQGWGDSASHFYITQFLLKMGGGDLAWGGGTLQEINGKDLVFKFMAPS